MEKKVKDALAESGFAFKKQFGQNFITDKNLLSQIVERSGVNSESTVIEIGSGAGTLTRAIAERAKKVYAYEIDTKLQPVLAGTLAGCDNAEVIFKDFLKVRLDELEKTLPEYLVVANLPYYITTPLIMTFLEHSKKCKSLTVMVQEEVANRLCAEADTPDYGAITANIALRGTCEKLLAVSRSMFYPQPNVDSAVVKIDIEDKRLDVKDVAVYKKVVQAAFSSRRKTLENNLVNGFGLSRGQAKAALAECGIDEKARGETLTPEQFAILTDKLIGIL